jgi:hypothetical protein
MMRKLSFLTGCALILLLVGCSEPAPTVQKEAEKPPQLIGGLSAFWKMYAVARSVWDPGCEVLKMGSISLSQVPAVRGKSAAWGATFVSAAKGKSLSYTFSVVEAEGNLHKDVFAGSEEPWSGSDGQNLTFPALAVKIDTDAALATALKKAVDYEKRYPGKPISVQLEKVKKYQDPVWRIIWGESAGTSDFSVSVDASTGDYVETLH